MSSLSKFSTPSLGSQFYGLELGHFDWIYLTQMAQITSGASAEKYVQNLTDALNFGPPPGMIHATEPLISADMGVSGRKSFSNLHFSLLYKIGGHQKK